MTKMNVESLSLDHAEVVVPYIRLAGTMEGISGDVIKKYDSRLRQSNKAYMDMPALYSLEHLMAEHIRNHSDKAVDLSPMGRQTDFCVSFIDHDDYEDVLGVAEKTLNDVLEAIEVPACNEVQCGWATSYPLEGAKAFAEEFLDKCDQWNDVFGGDK